MSDDANPKMPEPKIEYCLFDMDGLLIDSERIYTDVTNQILNRYGYELSWDVKSKLMGTPSRVSAEILLSSYNLQDTISIDDYIAESERLREELFKKVQPMKGAVELIIHLHEHGIPIAVATGSAKAPFLLKTSHLPHMFDRFPADAVVTADSPEMKPGRGKPCPDVFLAAARRLGRNVGFDEEPANEEERIERSKALVFEDAVPGAQAGVRAGMNVVWVPEASLKALDPLATHGAKVIIESLNDFRPEQWGLPAFPDQELIIQ